jgi:hypothetical protein
MPNRTISHRARSGLLVSAAALAAMPGQGAAQESPMSESTPSSSPQATPVIGGDSWISMVNGMWDSLQATFYKPEDGLYTEHYPIIPGRRHSYLWPYSGVLSGANVRARVNDDAASKEDLRRVLDNLEQYFDANGDPPGYDSYVVAQGGGTKFYDDNQWLGIDFILAYRTLGDERYLEKARLIWDFTLSGWSDDMGGGFYWNEDEVETKNTCSNGPGADLALLLYEETGEEAFLDWAVRIMEWLDANLFDEATGVYHDNIRADGTIDETKYTYNAGTPLTAYSLLYKATGEQSWLDKAKALAPASLAHFASGTVGDGVPHYPATPWFNSILMRGYADYYDVDPDKDPTYLASIADLLGWSWARNRDEYGFMFPDWGLDAPTTNARWLLDQAPVMEIAGLAHLYLPSQS